MNSGSWRNRVIRDFNLSYYVENKASSSNSFTQSLQQTQDNVYVYDNGKIRIWCLDKMIENMRYDE